MEFQLQHQSLVFKCLSFRVLCYTVLTNQYRQDWASLVAQLVKNLPAMQETWVQSPAWEDPPGEGKGNLLQYSGLENSMDCIVHGVAKSQTRLSDFHFHKQDSKGRISDVKTLSRTELPTPGAMLWPEGLEAF